MRHYTKATMHKISNGYMVVFEMSVAEFEAARRQFENAENKRLEQPSPNPTALTRDEFHWQRVFELYCADPERIAIAIHRYLKE